MYELGLNVLIFIVKLVKIAAIERAIGRRHSVIGKKRYDFEISSKNHIRIIHHNAKNALRTKCCWPVNQIVNTLFTVRYIDERRFN